MASGIKISDEFHKKFGKKFPTDTYLFREGDAGNSFFIINSGKVAVLKETPAGAKLLSTLSEGDFFGEMAMVGLQEKRAAAAKALVDTTVIELNRDAFEGLIRRSPDVAMAIIRSMAERLRDSNGKLSALIHKDDRIRVSNYLSFLAVERGQPAPENASGKCFVFKVNEASDILAVEANAIQNFIEKLKKARFLGQNGDWLWVPYPQYLQPFASYLIKQST